jgi:predicted HAD superfamily Cof-like phosphohydrolase
MEHRREGRVITALAECLDLFDKASRTSYAAMLDEWSEATGGDSQDLEAWGKLRSELIDEEHKEVQDALAYYVQTGDPLWLAKELSDLVYVCFGTAQRPDIDLDTAFRIVHRSNMTKIHPDGTYRVREDGKILKPDTYVPPNMIPAIEGACS